MQVTQVTSEGHFYSPPHPNFQTFKKTIKVLAFVSYIYMTQPISEYQQGAFFPAHFEIMGILFLRIK